LVKILNSLILKFLSITFLFNCFSYTQNPDKQIYLSINPLITFSSNDFEDFWNSDVGLLSEFRFDHAIGQLGAGLSIMKFNSKNDLIPGFYGVDYYFLYRKHFELFSDFNLMLGLDIGIYEFRFEDKDYFESTGEKNEREFSVKLVSGFSFNISESWSSELGIGYSFIYTKKRIELTTFRIGLVKSFTAPSWLQEFLE